MMEVLSRGVRSSPWWRGVLKRRPFVAGFLTAVAVYGVVDLTPLTEWLLRPLVVSDTQGRAAAVVALAAGVDGACQANAFTARRVLAATRIFRDSGAQLLVLAGGKAGGVDCILADSMADLTVQAGVPMERLRLDRTSTNTWTNAERAGAILAAAGIGHVVLVTDQLHMRRAELAFRAHGFGVERHSVRAFSGDVPRATILALGLREIVALGWYRIQAWRGVAHRPATPGAVRLSAAPEEEAVSEEALNQPVVLLGASYAKAWPLAAIGSRPVINAGIGGQRSFEMAERFERDVLAHRPHAVILWGFINDIFRAPSTAWGEALQRTRDSYRQMVDQARRHGITPIIATEVTITGPATWQERIIAPLASVLGRESYHMRVNRHVLDMNEWLREFARVSDVPLLDFQAQLAARGGERARQYAQDDGSHINAAGYQALTDLTNRNLRLPVAGTP